METLSSVEMTGSIGIPDSPEPSSRSSIPSDIHKLGLGICMEQPVTNREDTEMGEIRELRQALPTMADIEAIIIRVTEAHQHELQEVRSDVQQLTIRVAEGEFTAGTVEKKKKKEDGGN